MPARLHEARQKPRPFADSFGTTAHLQCLSIGNTSAEIFFSPYRPSNFQGVSLHALILPWSYTFTCITMTTTTAPLSIFCYILTKEIDYLQDAPLHHSTCQTHSKNRLSFRVKNIDTERCRKFFASRETETAILHACEFFMWTNGRNRC